MAEGGATTATPASTGIKRKRMPESKFYAVRLGHTPGIYHSWPDCLDQSNPSPLSDAEKYMKGDTISNGKSRSAPQKYYAVQSGRVPGVYTDWSSAQAQIDGWTKPRHKAFTTRAEAELFVREGTWDSTPADKNGATKPPAKKQKKKGGKEDSVALAEEDVEYEPGEGPLPSDAEDGFDPRILLDPTTGKAVWKSEEHLNATKWQATGSSDETGVLRIYTDGSSLGNGGMGATAGRLTKPVRAAHRSAADEPACGIDSNLEGTRTLSRDRRILICTDSNYSIKCVTEWYLRWRDNGWLNASKKPVENKDLIEKIVLEIEERDQIAGLESRDPRGHNMVKFQWVKGHKDDEGNIAADRLAVQGAQDARQLFNATQ
ncbi:hypothetical protein H2203_006599 [Taxawa tesnikishii (nom. ined.)]|nr:hypothetical protein H2203_006599 [Dothideales sp. JES 119]